MRLNDLGTNRSRKLIENRLLQALKGLDVEVETRVWGTADELQMRLFIRRRGVELTEVMICQNCGGMAPYSPDQYYPISDLIERISPGEVVPASECGTCHSLTSLERVAVHRAIAGELNK